MRGWQSLSQWSHLWMVSNLLELLRSFLRARLLVASIISFVSPDLRCLFKVFLHLDRSTASPSQDSVSMSRALMSLLQTSLNRRCGRPVLLLPVVSSPCGRPPCGECGQASVVCAALGGCTCWEGERGIGPRCWVSYLATIYPGYDECFSGGRC